VVVAERNLGILSPQWKLLGIFIGLTGSFAIIYSSVFDGSAKQEGASYAPSVTSIIC
jgi:hypothetical protein